jgi:hypothetical protein
MIPHFLDTRLTDGGLGCELYAPAALYPQKTLLVLIFVRGCLNFRAMVLLEGLGKLKKKTVTSLGLEPATFRLIAQRLNHIRYPVPLTIIVRAQIK